MKFPYQTSDETIKVFNGHVPEIAEELGHDKSLLYKILANVTTDPFAVFARFYKACLSVGCDTGPWERKLEQIKIRNTGRNRGDVVETWLKMIDTERDIEKEMAKAISDGRIDEREADRIVAALGKRETVSDALRTQLQGIWDKDNVKAFEAGR